MLSPNPDRIIEVRSRGAELTGDSARPASHPSHSDGASERSGSRLRLDASFRRVTVVGAYQPSFRRRDLYR